MWIKTKGGYLLNLDSVDYLICENDNTYAMVGHNRYFISDKNIINRIGDNLRHGTTIMEVR